MPPSPRANPAYTLRLLSPGICRQPAPRIKESPFSSKFSSRNYIPDTTKSDIRPYLSKGWLSELKARIGKCIMFGCNREQAQFAAALLHSLTTEWRELLAGSNGYLTGGGRGLEKQRVVWGEMDSFGHVNNANYIRYAESARVNWIMHFATVDRENGARWRELMTPKETGLILKSIKAWYKFPMTYPDSVSVYHKLRFEPAVTHTSLVLDCCILSHRHRRIAANTEDDVVFYDYALRGRARIPSFALETFRDMWRKQQEEMLRVRARIAELVRAVKELEKWTWDREDATEDFGGGERVDVRRDDVTKYNHFAQTLEGESHLLQFRERGHPLAERFEKEYAKQEGVKQEEVKTKDTKKDNVFTNTLGRGIRSLF
ncbi:thioesterase-like superfamily-domain-containing protein [Daldinia bambusicola]|nr:thioesterase-like superfamily-domain-containing protein [Daldinia bambusicola]